MAIVILSISGLAFIGLIILIIMCEGPCKNCPDKEKCWCNETVCICPHATREDK